ncbi:sn-glycerol-3-phosphate ABC transporter substrate-binding protein UgpB [Azospirillum sp. RWY-5-1]|uniref:sn-glycerol-3-phosphate-binding periplasmic protein UgpB n=1 Tax=Azospirillum oleiclasticum TaxID=2735135 RepID=A0ABX2TAQ0_9PROT|nr:sn-glycerol-3-phosphate ABC transporter substrate-binding protein UgpB [Azospirillum oleiclasticum]NYZ15251.1 sn-glycerol-3-phosphate ABC transporter substrate-binding protein UgpB [Azospirillum oleiclasticum]NYZ21328.1 sn-glycerol-3-phosphate ABC transporter substrate-binding protein UgpB [Azospirillum oleiclasticum]
MIRFKAALTASALTFAVTTLSAQAATELQWWHAMTGANNETVERLAKEFNESQSDYKVVPVFKGTYPETLNAGIAAFRARQAPHIIQVFDVGTGVMMGARAAIKPVAEVMKDGGETFEIKNYLPGIVGYYSTSKGELLSFPFNSSSPIAYYNVKALRQAGLDPAKLPKTWHEVFDAARKIKASGWACGVTTTWPTWIGLENFAAWNNVAYATDANGLNSLTPKLKINEPIFVDHWDRIATLQKEGVFQYGGRTVEAKNKFLSGECAILTESSGGIGDMIKSGMEFTTGPLPYYPEAAGAPQNTVPGGASLWVFAGKPAADYKGVAKFFTFLSQTPVQARLHQVSGYLPVTFAAYEQSKKDGFYEKNPGREQPILQMIAKQPTDNSRGIRLVNMPAVRDIENEEIEALLAGKQDAKTALNRAVERANAAIETAAKAVQQ